MAKRSRHPTGEYCDKMINIYTSNWVIDVPKGKRLLFLWMLILAGEWLESFIRFQSSSSLRLLNRMPFNTPYW